MAVTKMPVATDSAAELHDLIGEDATATFESDPKFIDSDAAGGASSENVEVQRETDDAEDEDEEFDEEDEEDDLDDVEDDDELEDDDEFADEDDDDDEEVEDDAEEAVATAGLTSIRGSSAGVGVAEVEEEDDDVGDVEQGVDDDESDEMDTDRVADTALRMMAMFAVTAEYAQFAAGL